MKQVIIMGIVVLILWKTFFSGPDLSLPEITFDDVSVQSHTLISYPSSNYLIVPWIDNCSYSSRTLSAFQQLVAEKKLHDVYAFYINPMTNDSLSSHKNVQNSLITHSAAQDKTEVISSLAENLFSKNNFRPGDFYVVTTDNKVKHISTRRWSNEEMSESILEAIH